MMMACVCGGTKAEIEAEKAKRARVEGQQGGGDGRDNNDDADVRVGEEPTDIEHIEASLCNVAEAVSSKK